MPSPAKIDPTRTYHLRQQYSREMNARFRWLQGKVLQLVDTEDAFGIRLHQDRAAPGRLGLVQNTRFAFESDPGKVQAFRVWLREQTDAGVLATDTDPPWQNQYVESAHKKGITRAYTDTHALQLAKEPLIFQATKKEFLETAFNMPETVRKLELLYTRNFTELAGVTDTVGQQLSRHLAEGLADGKGARDIARTMSKAIGSLSKTRALLIAQTELARAHAEGQLDGFELLGVDKLGVDVEWLITPDDKVCPRCIAMSGKVFTVNEARGLLPLHPRCRCAFVPYHGEAFGPEVPERTLRTRAAAKKKLKKLKQKA